MDPIEHVRQKKIDSLLAKHLHVKERAKLNKVNQLIDALALVVPGIYLSVRLLAKGTRFGEIADQIGELLAAVLFALTALKFAYRWQDKAQEHSRLMGENISIVGIADNMLAHPQHIESQLPLFSALAQKSEIDDRNALGRPNDSDRKEAYREALKESGGKDVCCPVCNSSPWKFTPGTCQACGNQPA